MIKLISNLQKTLKGASYLYYSGESSKMGDTEYDKNVKLLVRLEMQVFGELVKDSPSCNVGFKEEWQEYVDHINNYTSFPFVDSSIEEQALAEIDKVGILFCSPTIPKVMWEVIKKDKTLIEEFRSRRKGEYDERV